MTTLNDAPAPLAPRPRGGVAQSIADSLVVAKRNLIRMTRIPNLVRSVGFRFSSVDPAGLRVSALATGKGWAK